MNSLLRRAFTLIIASSLMQFGLPSLLAQAGKGTASDRVSQQRAPSAPSRGQERDNQKPQLVVQLGHTGRLQSVAISSDQKLVLTGSADKTAKLWEAETGREIRTLKGHSGEVSFTAISPDNKLALTAGDDKTVRLWNLETGEELRQFGGEVKDDGDSTSASPAITSISFSPDGKYLLSVKSGIRKPLPSPEKKATEKDTEKTEEAEKTLEVWDTQTGRLVHELESVASGVVSPKGSYLLTIAQDGQSMSVWDMKTGEEVYNFNGAAFAQFSPSENRILTLSSSGVGQVWETRTFKELKNVRVLTDQMLMSEDDHYLLAKTDKSLKLWT